MKQEVYHPTWLFLSKILSGLLHPLWLLFSHTKYFPAFDKSKIKKIIIGEYHCIGDVVLIIPALKVLKKSFPDAELTLITNPDIRELAEEMKIAHEVVFFQAPWVRGKKKWKLWKNARSLAVYLQQKSYDLGIDFKGDLRNLYFLWKIKPSFRAGFTASGGKFLLTHPFDYPFQLHQSNRALSLLNKLGISYSGPTKPLSLPKPKDSRCNQIVIHPGANHPERKWPVTSWVKLIQNLRKTHEIVLVCTKDLIQDTEEILLGCPGLETFKGTLLEFSCWLQNQKLLVGPDSMAVHLAVALDVLALSIFGSQNPNLTRPCEPYGHIVQPKLPCTHKRKNWRLCSRCLASIKPKIVYEKIIEIIPERKLFS